MGVCGCGECLLETARLFKGKVLGTPVPLLLVMVCVLRNTCASLTSDGMCASVRNTCASLTSDGMCA